MKQIILTSHGALSEGLKSMSEMVLGKLDIKTISFEDDMGIEIFKTKVQELFGGIDFDTTKIMIACDLKNGTPYNVFLQYILSNNLQDKVTLCYGMNFPMIITLVEWLENDIAHDELKTMMEETQKEQVGMFEFILKAKQQDEF